MATFDTAVNKLITITSHSHTCRFFAVLLSLVYRDIGRDQKSIQDRIGILFFITINQSFAPMAGVLAVFPAERNVVHKERVGGAYSTSAYFLSRVLAEVPLNVIIPTIYGSIIYWAVGLNPDPYRYLTFVAIVLLETHCAVALGYAISSMAPDAKVAQAVGPPLLIVLILFGGFYINTASLPPGSEWVQYISYIKWAFQALALNEFEGATFDCGTQLKGCEPTGEVSSAV